MPHSVFDLGGELTVDTTQLKSISEQVEAEMGRVSEQEAKAKVSVDDSDAKSKVKSMGKDVADLGSAIEKKRTITVDTAQAKTELEKLSDAADQARARLGDVKAGGGGIGHYLSGNAGMAIGGMMLSGGLAGVAQIAGGAIKSAYAVDLMEKSTEQVFGAAADSYKAEAAKMADTTGFLTQQVLAAQIAMNKTVQLNSGEVTRDGRTTQVGLGAEQVQPLVARAADLADTSGLPKYANNLEAVTSAISAGLRGTTGALLDFGIRLDDLYVLSLPVNAQFKALGESITPAEMAVARYNAVMEQTATIAGKASENQGDVNESMREFNQKMEGAKEAVGEALIPVANTLADFIAAIPKELLQASIWAGLGVAIATTLGGAAISIKALIEAIRSLGRQAAATAIETAASGGGGKGLLGRGLLGRLAGGARGLLGGGAAGGGAAAAGGGAAASGGAAAGGGVGAAVAAAGTISSAALALPAAMAAGTAAAILLINKSTNTYMDQAAAADERQTKLMQQMTAKLTGMGDPSDPLQADYVATKWGRDYKTGKLISFNKYTQRLGGEAQEWQRQYHAGDTALGVKTTVTIVDRTSAGVRASALDSGAYEQSVR